MLAKINSFLVNATPDGLDDLSAEIEFVPDFPEQQAPLVALLDAAHLANAVLTPVHEGDVLKVKLFISSELPPVMDIDTQIETTEQALNLLRDLRARQLAEAASKEANS